MFYFYFERKNDKVLTFNIVNFPDFEISTPSNKHHTGQFQNLISAGTLTRGNTVAIQKTFFQALHHLQQITSS